MQKSIIYLLLGTVLSFLLNYYFLGTQGWKLELYYGFSFGLGWGLAYFIDHPEWVLSKKLGISFIGIGLLFLIGFFAFKLEFAIFAIVKFSAIFVVYYLFASFRESKSLRQ